MARDLRYFMRGLCFMGPEDAYGRDFRWWQRGAATVTIAILVVVPSTIFAAGFFVGRIYQ